MFRVMQQCLNWIGPNFAQATLKSLFCSSEQFRCGLGGVLGILVLLHNPSVHQSKAQTIKLLPPCMRSTTRGKYLPQNEEIDHLYYRISNSLKKSLYLAFFKSISDLLKEQGVVSWWQQDTTPWHKPHIVLNWFKNMTVSSPLFQWSPQSPDL